MSEIINLLKEMISQKTGTRADLILDETCNKILIERMRFFNINEEPEYLQRVNSSKKELQIFIEEVVNLETCFFRDEKMFYFLADMVRKRGKGANHPFRFLFIPCSTGEEPYSLLMALKEKNIPLDSVAIDAVDISIKAINLAQKGVYCSNSFRGPNVVYREKYFTQVNEKYQIHDDFLRRVKFLPGNLTEYNLALPNSEYDVIVCRNLLIYFCDEAQKKAFEHFDRLLPPEGVLLLTPVESEIGRKYGYQPNYTENRLIYYVKNHKQKVQKRNGISTIIHHSCNKIVEREQTNSGAAKVVIDEEGFLEKARQCADLAEYSKATSICIDYLSRHRCSADAYYLLGVIQHAQGNAEKAEEFFNKTIYLDPQHHQALVYLSLLFENKQDGKQAKNFRKRAKRYK